MKLHILKLNVSGGCFFILCLIFIPLFVESKTDAVCYVSSSEGRDSNDGDIALPFRTLKRAVESGADTILLKAGDVFYERMVLDGRVVDMYGNGDKPTLYGVKIPKKGTWECGKLEDGKWKKCASKIWRVNLSLEDDRYAGFMTGGSSFFNNVGAVVNLATDDMNGCRKVPRYDDMVENFDIWQDCPVEVPSSSTPQDFDYLYMYFDGNPNEYDFGMTMGTSAVSIKNGEVKNLNIKYWGYGIVFKDNVRISNCDIDGIGGHILRGYRVWVICGNGIESYISEGVRHDCIIEGCNVSRTFDCGATIQGGSKVNSVKAENIVFRNNTFKNCCQTYEEFLSGTGADDRFCNCVFEDNLSVDAGINTGFRDYANRYKRCHFLSGSYLRNSKMIIRNNIVVNGNYYCAAAYDRMYRQAQWEGNICIIKRGQDLLGHYFGTADVIKVPTDKGKFHDIKEATDSAISRYRYLTGDQTTEFIIIE